MVVIRLKESIFVGAQMIRKFNVEFRKKVWPKKCFGRVTLDMDSTVIGVTGFQEGAEKVLLMRRESVSTTVSTRRRPGRTCQKKEFPLHFIQVQAFRKFSLSSRR